MEKILTNRFFQIVLLLALLCVSVAFGFSHTRWREQARNFTFDNYNILKPRQASDSVVIVDIDEASLKEIGQMPWPRSIMADMVRKLDEMGAAVIVFDIVFSEPDRASPVFMARALEGTEGLADIAGRLTGLPDNDALFGRAIGEAGNVVTGFSFTNESTQAVPVQKAIFRGKNIEKFVPGLSGATVNLKEISRDAAGSGSFFVSADVDGIIRRVPMLVAHKREGANIVSVYPSLSLEAIRVLDKKNGGEVILSDPRYAALDPQRFGIDYIRIGTGKALFIDGKNAFGTDVRFVPTNARGEFLVYFAKSDKDWYIPAYRVLNGEYPADKIKDKIVLIGTSAVGLKDIRSTPLDTFIPGVEVHLNIIDQILQGEYLTRSIWVEGLEVFSVLCVGILIIVLSFFTGALAQAAIVFAAVSAFLFMGWHAFANYGILIDVTYPSFCILAIFVISSLLTYLRTEKERRAVRQAFGLYISPDFMKELTKDPDKLRLGGESRDLTVMFTDIRKFTTICEGLSPEEIIHLMNDFLTPMSDLVMQNRGTIDKYIGDAMMAFWNAPLDDPDHARHACVAALGMQAALEPINARIREKAAAAGKAPVLLQTGIGINTGPCAVGNMGSKQRFAYSTLGDAVNMASRLEGQTKFYGANILIGENTYNAVPGFATLEADLIRVKGKSRAERIFALLGTEDMAASPEFSALRHSSEEMIRTYRAGDFKKAGGALQECMKRQFKGMEGVYSLYDERIKSLLKNPPSSWDGIYTAETK